MALRKLTSLVDAAGEALGITEDPLATIIGRLVRIFIYYAIIFTSKLSQACG